jgi:hypothetical protein
MKKKKNVWKFYEPKGDINEEHGKSGKESTIFILNTSEVFVLITINVFLITSQRGNIMCTFFLRDFCFLNTAIPYACSDYKLDAIYIASYPAGNRTPIRWPSSP